MKRLFRPFFLFFALAMIAGTPLAARAAEESEQLTLNAPVLTHLWGVPVTNSMLVTFIVAAVIIVFAQFATRNMKEIPEGAQNFAEWLVEGLYNFLEGIVGNQLV